MSPIPRRWQKDIEAKQYEERLVGRWALCSKNRLGLITGRKELPWGMSWTGIGVDSKEWASRDPRILVDADCEVLNSLADVLEIRLTQSVQRECLHAAERIIDSKSTDSDSEVWTYWCPDCRRLRDEEVVGSKARAEAEGFQWPADADDYLEPLLP